MVINTYYLNKFVKMDQRIVHRLLDNCYKAHDECKSEDWKLFWLNTAEKISKKYKKFIH